MNRRQKLSTSLNDLNDNQFLDRSASGGYKRQSIGNLYQKDGRIKKLQERNVMLQRQVIKIERALVGIQQQKEVYGIKLPQIKADVIKKQLENAYKMIKQYEHQITKREKHEFDGKYVQQVRKYQQIIKQKQQLNQKIRKQISQIRNQSIEYTKLLKDDAFKKQKQQKQDKNNADIKWLQQKIKKANHKKKQQEANLEKQFNLIKKIQKQLIKLDYSQVFLDNIKNRIFTKQNNQKSQQSDQQIQQPYQNKSLQPSKSTASFHTLETEIKLYTKLVKDYQQRLSLLAQENKNAEQKNYKSRNKIVQTEYEIQKIQNRINQLKQMINPKALVPTKMQMITEQRKKYQSVKIQKSKISMPHFFKYAEVGQATKAGKRFIDRPLIGKTTAKIIQIIFFQKKDGPKNLLGFQTVYAVDKHKKRSNINILADKNIAQQKHFVLEQGDFVKTIDCMLNEQKIVVGVSMVSKRNVILKAGQMTQNRSAIQMQSNQYPICLYGCLLEIGLQMLGAELAQE